MARSAAAIVHGYRTFDPEVDVAGRDPQPGRQRPPRGAAARGDRRRSASRCSARCAATTRSSPPSATSASCRWPSASRATRAALDALAAAAARTVDLDAVAAPRARRARAPRPAVGARRRTTSRAPARIAIARGPAFSFHYEENLELLARAPAPSSSPFDPLADERAARRRRRAHPRRRLPRGLRRRAGGQRGAARRVAAFAARGRPILAECGGLLYLARELDGRAMCGVLPARGRMTGRLTLGYREATAATDDPVSPAGTSRARARVPLLRASSRRRRRAARVDADRARHDARRGPRRSAPCRPATCTSTGPRTATSRTASSQAAVRGPVAA